MTKYCEEEDLVLSGDIPLPSYINKTKFIEDAADEIDSQLGFIYETPFDVTDTSSLIRPARLLLKRINKFLASGRIILSVATPGEDTQVHSYGRYLVREAENAIKEILSGNIILEGATPIVSTPSRAPLIANAERRSYVEVFYDDVTSPSGLIDARRGVLIPEVERYLRQPGG